MNDEFGAGHDSRKRARFRLDALTAVLVGAIVLTSACGNSTRSGASSGLPTLQTLTASALAYAKCMRAHGVPNFPDPTVLDNSHAKGISFPDPGNTEKNSPRFRSAVKGCQRQTGFGQITPAMLQAAMAAGVKFANCMRSQGISDYPDPVENGQGIRLGPGPDSGIDMNSARYKAAQKACFPLLPNGGP
jgi:hypothetical protein